MNDINIILKRDAKDTIVPSTWLRQVEGMAIYKAGSPYTESPCVCIFQLPELRETIFCLFLTICFIEIFIVDQIMIFCVPVLYIPFLWMSFFYF